MSEGACLVVSIFTLPLILGGVLLGMGIMWLRYNRVRSERKTP